jgi:membrane protein insertase Oxa1/YidC/SpoIIIJ
MNTNSIRNVYPVENTGGRVNYLKKGIGNFWKISVDVLIFLLWWKIFRNDLKGYSIILTPIYG